MAASVASQEAAGSHRLDVHVAAALNAIGGLFRVREFPATAGGYRALTDWLSSFGTVVLVGVEGTGSYGAGLSRWLHTLDIDVVEVDRPNRQQRRRVGKSDPVDAIEAARAALSGRARGPAKTRTGNVEAIRALRVARSSARKDRVRALNQLRSLVSTAPEELRAQLRDSTIFRLIERASAMRPGQRRDVIGATKLALRTLARRVLDLDNEMAELDAVLAPLVRQTATELVARPGIGTDCAGALLVAAGDNPSRLRNERTLAHLCGASPLDASSGKQQTPSTQPWRRPHSEQRPVASRRHPAVQRSRHEELHRTPNERRTHEARSDPMPQALHRPRGLPMSPAPNTGLTTPRSIITTFAGA
jgi:transposase